MMTLAAANTEMRAITQFYSRENHPTISVMKTVEAGKVLSSLRVEVFAHCTGVAVHVI